MHDNPAQDWQALAENYRRMLDGELENLASNFDDLTGIAQQVLRNELQNRGLALPGVKTAAAAKPDAPAGMRWGSSIDAGPGSDRQVGEDDGNGDGAAPEFTWKTPLCECDDREHALALCEVLKKAGIESWYEDSASGWGIGGPRVVVAADQLEEARAIAMRPIPQETVDFYREDPPEYLAPRCPGCHAEDPVLESAEPANSWLCEACGRQWIERIEDPVTKAEGRSESSGR